MDAEHAAARSLLEVTVANESPCEVDEARLTRAVHTALEGSEVQAGEISVALVDDDAMQAMNRRYLQHDYPTDVLSFALEWNPPQIVGQIVASPEFAARSAVDASWSAADELTLYVIHGALHLAGYDDHDPTDAAAMRAAEARALDSLGIRRAPADARWHDHAKADQEVSSP